MLTLLPHLSSPPVFQGRMLFPPDLMVYGSIKSFSVPEGPQIPGLGVGGYFCAYTGGMKQFMEKSWGTSTVSLKSEFWHKGHYIPYRSSLFPGLEHPLSSLLSRLHKAVS